MSKVYLLDYVAGNIRSLVNAIEKLGYTVEWIRSPEDVEKADVSWQRRIGSSPGSLPSILSAFTCVETGAYDING
jgi:hypothetical protein